MGKQKWFAGPPDQEYYHAEYESKEEAVKQYVESHPLHRLELDGEFTAPAKVG